MIDLTKIYKNYTSTGHWTKDDEDCEANIISLATALRYEGMKNDNRPKKSMAPGVQPRLKPWKFVYQGKINTINGVKYVL